MSKISVIIPLYNKAACIGRALESVFSQSFQDFEIIVIDDGSTDDGPEIVGSFEDSRLRLIHQANSGPGAARNRGTGESRCDYVAFLDADDEWLPEFLQTSLDNLESSAQCALTVTAHYVGQERQLWPGLDRLNIVKGPWRLPPNMDASVMGAALAFIHSAGAVLCRRSVLGRFGGFYENDCVYGEDLYLWLQVMLNYPIFRDPTPLFRQHTEDSDLVLAGQAADGTLPVMPFLTSPEPIRVNCPPQYKTLLERYLAYEALCSAHKCATAGNLAAARYLAREYPLMKRHRVQYAKLRYKLALPATVPFLQKLRRTLRPRPTAGPLSN
jgi:glycosyltransferase involved in cell wall biosynthesis